MAFVIFSLAACQPQNKENTEVDLASYERVNANTNPNADKILALYAYGMAITQSYDCTNPASWYYQGSMHAVPPRDSITGDTDSLCHPYDSGNTFRAWNSCPHMYRTDKQLNFLTWHRLYIYYYERNIRYQIANGGGQLPGLGEEVANQFSLPYWDYTNYPLMTKPFAQKTIDYEKVHLSRNPLFELGRSKTLMAGQPIDYKSKDSIAINVNDTVRNLCLNTMKQALDYDKLLALNDVSEFSRGLEDRLHNVMHDYIGGAVDSIDKRGRIYNRIYQNAKSGYGLMGQIPSAGFDPIFFLHHSNVDRLFAAWEALYGPISIEDMNTYGGTAVWEDSIRHIYQFWDSPTNSWITYSSMQEMLDAAHAVDYSYESLPAMIEEVKSQKRKALIRQIVHEKEMLQPKLLNEIGEAFKMSLSNTKAMTNANSRYTMEVDLSFGKNMFQQLVIFSLPPGFDWNACDLDSDYIHGVCAFFGSTHEMHAGMHGNMEPGQEFSHKLLVDVTHAVKNLSVDVKQLEVYIVPLNSENGPDFYVTKLRLYEHQ
jgi:hypothetical protein